MSIPKGLIVRVKCFALYVFSPCFSTVLFVWKNVVTTMWYQAVQSPRLINRMLSIFPVCPELCCPPHSEDAGLSMTLAAVWWLLRNDRECLVLLEVWLMASVSLSGPLSTRRIAEGHCVCSLASSALLLYRNALIDIP